MIVWWMSNTKESRYVVSGLKPILRIKSNPGSIALLLLAFGIGPLTTYGPPILTRHGR